MRFLEKTILRAALACLFLVSCEGRGDTDPIPNRVVLVYLGGDNNLFDETYVKADALKKGWNPFLQGKLVIYSDPADDVPKLKEIASVGRNPATETVIKTYEESNSADSAVFASIIRDVKAAYPAHSYGLILFSHASGWLPKATLTMPRSIIIDQGNEMELTGFAAAIPDRAFDFIILEACFTAGIEMAYELKDKTNYIMASSAEILSPGFSDIYSRSVADFFAPTANLNAFAQRAFDYFDGQSGDFRSATFSVLRTDKLQALADWVKNSGVVLSESIIGSVQHFDRYSHHLFFDFFDSYRQTLTAAQSAELERLIGECVVYRNSTGQFMPRSNGFTINVHSGLTTYIPQAKYPYLNEEYLKLAWAKAINLQ
jgi:hypothetical protein